MTKEYDGKGRLLSTRRRVDLAGGITADISDESAAVTELKAPNADEARTLARFLPQSDCTLRVGGYDNRPRVLRRESILGYDSMVFETTGQGSKTTTWVAPKLNCAELVRVDELLNPTGFPSDKVKVEATKVQLGDPDGALFDIPSTYARVSFSEKFRRDLTAAKMPVPSDYKQRFQKEDQLYERLKFWVKPERADGHVFSRYCELGWPHTVCARKSIVLLLGNCLVVRSPATVVFRRLRAETKLRCNPRLLPAGGHLPE